MSAQPPKSTPSSPTRPQAQAQAQAGGSIITEPTAGADAETQALHHALIQWVSSFSSALSRPCSQIDKDWFRLIGTLEHTPTPASLTSSATASSSSAHWIPRYNNLKKLHRLLCSYLTDVLGMPDPTTSPSRAPILLDKIARHADTHQLALLTSLLLVVAALETSVQARLMQVIEAHLQAASVGHAGMLDRGDDPVVSQVQVAQLLMEKRQIEARHRQLQQDYEQLAADYEMIATTSTKPRLATTSSTEILHSPLSPTSSTSLSLSQSTTAAAATAGTLTADLTIARDECRSSTHARRPGAQVGRLGRSGRTGTHVKDQVDEMQDVGAQLARAQAQVEKWKARVAEAADVKRQVKEGEEERVRLKAQGDASTTSSDVERERKVASEWEARYLALQEQHARVVAEVESEVARERERVGELVEQVRELEDLAAATRVQGESLSSLGESSSSSSGRPPANDADLGERAKLAAEAAALRAQVADLRQERETMHAQFEGHKQLLAKARALIVQANKERAELVEQHAAELSRQSPWHRPNPLQPQPPLCRIIIRPCRRRNPDAFPEAIQALQLQIEGYQRETQALWAENKALRDQWRREQAWMASAWYQVVSAKSSGVSVGANGATATAGQQQVGNTWLAQQRRLLSEHIMKQF
ncbi:hypothetical protein BCR44DRAFT_1426448 [Catenaria anguillulae PL171]|uniref:HOOK N-terminal domain-containing protein n=1 Tax=Catenaria anguillulae PL171 TaxID=765915 RepID=A0A1Y2I1V2_9FUNG|nr:hypothetical protein BCR44DRAFT_1426448 [Catenaria anguillulae PL171]